MARGDWFEFVFFFLIIPIYVLSVNCSGLHGRQDDYPTNKFNYRHRYEGIFTKEDNVTWKIAKDLRTIAVRRRSRIYTDDNSTIQLGIQYDHVSNVSVGIYSSGRKVFWPFFYTKRYLVFTAEEMILDQISLDINGTMGQHSGSAYQVGHTLIQKTKEREFFAYASLYPYRSSEMMPGVMHNRLTRVNLTIEMENSGYTILTPNHLASHTPELYYPEIYLDTLGFVILKTFDAYFITNQIKLVVHRVSNENSVPLQVYPLIRTVAFAVNRLKMLFNFTITERITVVLLPHVTVRPMAFVKDICIMDTSIAAASDLKKLFYIIKCLVQQNIMRELASRDFWTHRWMKAIRDQIALMYTSHRDLGTSGPEQLIAQRMLQLTDEQELAVKYKWVDRSGDDLKAIVFMGVLRAQYQQNHESFQNFETLIWSFVDDPRFVGGTQSWSSPKVLKFVDLVMVFRRFDKLFNYSHDVPVKTFLTGWLKEPGYPIMRARISNDTNTGVAQIHLMGSTTSSYKKDFQLYFPVHITIESDVNRSQVVEGSGRLLKHETLKDSYWFLANETEAQRSFPAVTMTNRSLYYYLQVNGTSMYRVFYRDENWRALLKYFDRLPVAVRAKLVSDVHYFHARGELSWRYEFQVLRRLRSETSALVWESAEKMIMDLEKRLRYTRYESDFHMLMINVTKKFYESREVRHPLAVKLACMMRMRLCLKEAANRTKELIASGETFPRFEDVLCGGIREIDDDYFQYLVSLSRSVTFKRRYVLMIALTCVQDYKRLYGLLHQAFVLESILAPVQVKIMMLSNMFLASTLGSTVVLTFMQNNHAILTNYIAPVDIEPLMSVFSDYLKRRHEYRQVRQILLLTSIEPHFVLNKIQRHIVWTITNDLKLQRYLTRKMKLKRLMY